MRLYAPSLCFLLLRTIAPASIQAQPMATRVTPRSFDVASVKLNQSGGESRRAGTSPGGAFTATNVTLKLLISRAYGVAEAQIEGGPGWIDTETYDIAAKADTPLEMSREEVRPCLQALLAERFQLAVHRGTKPGAVFSLVLAKNGPKFRQHSGSGQAGISLSSDSGMAAITGTKITMARLAEYLSNQAGRPVIDDTGLKGEYDFRVEWAADEKPGSQMPSVFTALQEQLGLKLNATRGTIEVIVVDRAERAVAN
jgi:uncharacterized protein (TIGR03435 family)